MRGGTLTEVPDTKEHPSTRDGLCSKLNNVRGQHTNPDRLPYPLRRSDPEGSHQFERISWGAALAKIGEPWREVITTDGGQAIVR